MSPATDEYNVVTAWKNLHTEHKVSLYVCVSAALRRGVVDGFNLASGFKISGLSMLAKSVLDCDRLVKF